jgi:hypothetical protein
LSGIWPIAEIGNLGLDGLRQKLPRTTAQNFSQRILKCAWLGELNDIILGHGVSSFNGKWRLEHPHDTPPHLITPSPTFAHSSYSPAECTGAIKTPIEGKPDPRHISTSYVERSNLTMRMSMRRFTRLTNAFSKKAENHVHALSLYFVSYNFMRIHKSLRVSPAMAAGIATTLMSWEDLIAMMDAEEVPQKRGPYKKAS